MPASCLGWLSNGTRTLRRATGSTSRMRKSWSTTSATSASMKSAKRSAKRRARYGSLRGALHASRSQDSRMAHLHEGRTRGLSRSSFGSSTNCAQSSFSSRTCLVRRDRRRSQSSRRTSSGIHVHASDHFQCRLRRPANKAPVRAHRQPARRDRTPAAHSWGWVI